MIKIFRFLSSVKLAVILILSLGVFLAVGTFYESRYGTALAQKHVYHSIYATALMFAFVVNLIFAVLDRYPWKKHHTGFIITHLGIITLIAGAFITQQWGLDGSLYLPIEASAKNISVEDTEIRIYQSLKGSPVLPFLRTPVDFDRYPPHKKSYVFPLVDQDKLEIISYVARGLRSIEVTPASKAQSPQAIPSAALEFELSNSQVQVKEWIGIHNSLPPFFDFGPAIVTFLEGEEFPPLPQARNEITFLIPKKAKSAEEILKFAIYTQSKGTKATQIGWAKQGQEIQTGWMGLKLRISQLVPNATVHMTYKDVRYGSAQDSPLLGPAIEAKIGENKKWFELDSPLEMKGDHLKYFISFARKRFDLGFSVHLKKFKMSHYEGSQIAKTYESHVLLDGVDEPQVISMNQPLKHKGYTLYQTSFEQNDKGEPIASVLSVNYDPGRKIKYFGSLLLVLGIATMFYIKPKWSRK